MFSTPAVAATLAGDPENRAWIQPDLDERAAKQLMDYVLKPTEENIKKAKAMIAANPKIMFIKTVGVEWASGVEETMDVTGRPRRREVHRRVKSSPFQAALGTGDKELYEFMVQHFDKVDYEDDNGEIIETGIQRAQSQIKEQFPSGFDYRPVEAEFTELMDKLVNAISIDPFDNNTPSPATQAVLKEFRHYFLPQEVTQGHHFNLNYLIEAFNRYNQNYNPWNGNQLSLFWRQVIGYLERLVPAVDAQAFCQGLYYRVERNQPPTRSLTVRNYETHTDIDYFSSTPVPGSTSTGLGFDFGIYIYAAATSFLRRAAPGALGRGAWAALGKLCQAKTSELNNFQHHLEQRAHQSVGESLNLVRNSVK